MNAEEVYKGPPTDAAWRSLVGSGYALSMGDKVLRRADWKSTPKPQEGDVTVCAVLQADLLTRVGYTIGRSNGVRYKKALVLDGDSLSFDDKPPSTTAGKDSLVRAWTDGYARGFQDGCSWYRVRHNDGFDDADKLYPDAYPSPK